MVLTRFEIEFSKYKRRFEVERQFLLGVSLPRGFPPVNHLLGQVVDANSRRLLEFKVLSRQNYF